MIQKSEVVLDTLLLWCKEQEEKLAGQADRYAQGKLEALRAVALVITTTIDTPSESRVRSASQR